MVEADAVHAAATVIGWRLKEARRLLSDIDTPNDLVAAIRLDAWLIAEARRSGDHRTPTPRVYRFERARIEEDGKRRFVVLNPALVSG